MKNRNYSVKLSLSGTIDSGNLLFEGDLGIKNAVAIKKSIQQLKFSTSSLTIQLKNVEKLDITTIQTLVALNRLLQATGKETSISSELQPEIKKLLMNTGFNSII